MARLDKVMTSKRKVQAIEWTLDIPPHNSIKSHKAAERQAGKKEIRKQLKGD